MLIDNSYIDIMPLNTLKEFSVFLAATPWFLGVIWWAVMMAQAARKGKKFKILGIILNLFVAWWVWIMVSYILPEDAGNFGNFCVSISWFLAYPLLDFLEDRWLDLLVKYFKRIAWTK